MKEKKEKAAWLRELLWGFPGGSEESHDKLQLGK
jgi:hypothetical protein